MRLLLVVHGWPSASGRDGSGGTELHARALAGALAADGVEVTVLTRGERGRRVHPAVRSEHDGALEILRVDAPSVGFASFADSYRNARLADLVEHALAGRRFDVVQVEHLTGLSSELPDRLAARGAVVLATLNDYWPFCHRGQLLDRRLHPCAGPLPLGCAHCVGPEGTAPGWLRRAFAGTGADEATGAPSAAPRFGRRLRNGTADLASAVAARLAPQAARFTPAAVAREASRARAAHLLDVHRRMALLLAPSAAIAARYVAAGVAPELLRPWRQGIELAPYAALSRRTPRSGGSLRAGFLGSLTVAKGPHVLADAMRRLTVAVELDVWGAPAAYHGDRRGLAALERRLLAPGIGSIAVHGPASRAEVPQLLATLDVLVVPSLWPENAPFVVKEAFAAGVPVIASAVGGLPELVHDGENGLLVPPGDAAALARALTRLAKDRALLARLRSGVRAPRDVADEARELRELHAELLTEAGRARRTLGFGSGPLATLAAPSDETGAASQRTEAARGTAPGDAAAASPEGAPDGEVASVPVVAGACDVAAADHAADDPPAPTLGDVLRRGRSSALAAALAAPALAPPRELEARRPLRRPRERPRTAAVLLDHRSPVDTLLAVRLLASAPLSPFLVVDSGGHDDDALRGRLPPHVEVMATPHNLGFAAGMNSGLRRVLDAGAERVLLLDADLLLPPAALARLHHALDLAPDAAIAAPLLLERSAPRRIASAGLDHDPHTGRLRHRAHGLIAARALPGFTDVDAAAGCCWLARRALFSELGLFDERWFLGFEDLDLCRRARQRGARVLVVDDAVAYHQGSGAIGRRSPARLYYAARNHLRFDAQPPAGRLRRLARVMVWNLLHALRGGEVPRLAGTWAVLRGALDAARGVDGPGAYAPP